MTGPLRLPGSLAVVDASPPGPSVGAFFDLDGTLVAGFTVAAVTRDRLRHREVGAAEFLQMMQLAVEYRLGRHQFENVIAAAVRTTKGRLAEDVDEVGERIFRQSVVDLIYPEMRELVRAHQRRGHTVVLSSSALTMQAEPVARYLGIDHVVCNRFVVDEHGVLTGEVQRPVIWGTSKATSVQKFAAEHGVDLRSSYFYADGDEDLALMHLVGNPRPVNPGPELTKVAARRGWPILRFSSRGGGGPLGRVGKLMDAAFIDRADTASAVAALAPIEEAARKGLSIVVAPEGTRLDTQSVGPFKKGAFRIAMATGLPVVPIVIRNSDSVAGRNSTTLNPGTVDVAVLPPVSTADWTVQNLQERIEQIRMAYVHLLAEWPAPGTAP